MAYPLNVKTRLVSFGGAATVEAGIPLHIRISTESSRSLIWVENGYRLESLAALYMSATDGQEIIFEVPTTDQNGWLDAATRQAIIVEPGEASHLYTTKLEIFTEDHELIRTYEIGPYAVPEGSGTLDADLLNPNYDPIEGTLTTYIPGPEGGLSEAGQQAAANAVQAAIDAEGYRDEAEGYRDEAEVFSATTAELQDAAVADIVRDATSDGGVAVREVAAPRIVRRPASPLVFGRIDAPSYFPLSASGVTEYVYFRNGSSNRVHRSSTQFTTFETGFSPSTRFGDSKNLVAAGETAEGFYAITSLGDESSFYFSPTFEDSSAWVLVNTGANVSYISIGKPTTLPTGTVFLVGEYGGGGGASRNVYLSRNGGQTWETIFTAYATNSSQANHIHHAAVDPHTYDPITDTARVWVSVGDGANCYFGYSDDWGASWVDVPADGVGPEVSGTIYNHPTIVTATSSRIITTPDGSGQGNGIWEVDKRTGAVSVAHEVNADPGYRSFARPPWAQRGDELYILFNPDLASNGMRELRMAATGDGGESWHTIWTVDFDIGGMAVSGGVVGPTASGKIYIRAVVGSFQGMLVAQVPRWESVASTADLVTNNSRPVAISSQIFKEISNSNTRQALAEHRLPPNYGDAGNVLKVTAFGRLINYTSIDRAVTLRLMLDDVEIARCGIGIKTMTAGQNGLWKMEANLSVVNGETLGGSSRFVGTAECVATLGINPGTGAAFVDEGHVLALPVVAVPSNHRGNRSLSITAQLGNASPDTRISLVGMTVEVLRRS